MPQTAPSSNEHDHLHSDDKPVEDVDPLLKHKQAIQENNYGQAPGAGFNATQAQNQFEASVAFPAVNSKSYHDQKAAREVERTGYYQGMVNT